MSNSEVSVHDPLPGARCEASVQHVSQGPSSAILIRRHQKDAVPADLIQSRF